MPPFLHFHLLKMDQKGQTALEYLLIVVVAIVVVVAVMLWMTSTSSSSVAQGSQQVNRQQCQARSCTEAVGAASPTCSGGTYVTNPCTHFCLAALPAGACASTATCVGTQNIGSSVVPGHCDIPAAAFYHV